MNSNTRLIVNTVVMYARVFITMIISLLASRWILLGLGAEDFGLFNLVAGLLTLMMFLNLSMSTATQRFISFYLTKDGAAKAQTIFYYSCILHLLVAIIVIACIEIGGQYMLDHFLSVPTGKENLAKFVLHTLSISTFFTIISVPYNACMLAHENMLFVAIISIAEAVLRFACAFSLLYIPSHRLEYYALVVMGMQILSTIAYRTYSVTHYAESKIKIQKVSDFRLLKEMVTYVGYNLIGSISSMLGTQGVSMLLNSFFGVIINAAYGIATQVQGQLTYFSNAVVSAARPQIVKSEGEGNRDRMLILSASACKMAFLLMSLFAIPLIIEMPYVLELWLKDVPNYTVEFSRLILILSLIFQFSIGVSVGVESVGNIKMLQIVVGTFNLLILPLGYVLLVNGFQPYSIIALKIGIESIALCLRLIISKKITGIRVTKFLAKTIIPSLFTFAAVTISCYFVRNSMDTSFLRLVLVSATSLITMTLLCFVYAFNRVEKEKFIGLFMTVLNKIKR